MQILKFVTFWEAQKGGEKSTEQSMIIPGSKKWHHKTKEKKI